MKLTRDVSVFTKLRVKITAVPAVLILVVLVITFSCIVWGEYNSKMRTVSEQMSRAVELNDKLVEKPLEDVLLETEELPDGLVNMKSVASEPSNENAEASQSGQGNDASGQPPASDGSYSGQSILLGANSSFTASDYVPIIIYKIDYVNNTLVPMSNGNANLTQESFDKACSTLIDANYGFARDDDSMLYYLKTGATNGDVIAFTDVSIVDAYISSISRAFALVVVLVSVMMAGIIWLISGWIVRPVMDAWLKQKQFVADASHELKTPISVIMANTSIILDSKDLPPADVRKWTESTQVEAENLNDLVADMLYLAANDTEKRVIKSSFNFSKVVQKTAMQFEARAFEKENEIDYDGVAKNIEVNGEESSLTRVVSILLDNACKYSHPNTVIKVRLEDDKKYAILSVEDEGDDIPEDLLESVFDRFFRVDKSRTGENGYGLGLAMAHDIVERHNGVISAESESGRTVFTVKIPKGHH